MSQQQEQDGVWDEFDGCYECGAAEKTPLCSTTYRVLKKCRPRVINRPNSVDAIKWEVDLGYQTACWHKWRGEKYAHDRWAEGVTGSLVTDCLYYSHIGHILDSQRVECRFCNADMPFADFPYHFDDQNLCGLRKTTLLGTVLTELHRAFNNFSGIPAKVSRLNCLQILNQLHFHDEEGVLQFDPLADNIIQGRFPYKKTVEFEDEEELRAKYKMICSLPPKTERRKELNPFKRIKEGEEDPIVAYTNEPYQPHTPIHQSQLQQQ